MYVNDKLLFGYTFINHHTLKTWNPWLEHVEYFCLCSEESFSNDVRWFELDIIRVEIWYILFYLCKSFHLRLNIEFQLQLIGSMEKESLFVFVGALQFWWISYHERFDLTNMVVWWSLWTKGISQNNHGAW